MLKQAKESLVLSQILTYYNPKLPIKMDANASAYRVGAVISYVHLDGSEVYCFCVTYPLEE